MPTLGDRAKQTQEIIDSGQVTPVDLESKPPIPVADYPVSPNPYLRTPLPGSYVQQPDMQRVWQTGAIPQSRIPPQAPISNAVAGAQGNTQARVQIAQQPVITVTSAITPTSGPTISVTTPAGPGTTGGSSSSTIAQNLDQLGDGTTYTRYLAIDATSNRLDFSRALLNKQLDNIPDGTSYGRTKQVSTNLVPDSEFLFGSVYWTLPAGNVFVQGKGQQGGNAIQSNFNAPFCSSASMIAVAGQTYTFSMFVDQSALSSSGGRTLELQVNVYDSGGGLLQQSDSSFNITNDVVTPTACTAVTIFKTSTYAARIAITFTAPANAAKMHLLTPQPVGGTAGTMLSSAPHLEVGSTASPYQHKMADQITGYLLPGSTAIDFSQSIHTNKQLDNIPDGTTYARSVASDMTSNRVDFSKSLLNKQLDNIPDGTTFNRLKYVNADNTLHVSTSLNNQANLPANAFTSGQLTFVAKAPSAANVQVSWPAFTVTRGDGTTISVTANTAQPVPSAPTVSQVAGGTSASTTLFFRIALIIDNMIMSVSGETSFTKAANNFFSVASPASQAGYDGWVPLAGGLTGLAGLSSFLVSGLLVNPIAFGTNFTESTGSLFSGSGVGDSVSNLNNPPSPAGSGTLTTPINLLVAASTAYFAYPFWDLALGMMRFAGPVLTAKSVTAAQLQSSDGKVAMSAGAVSFSTPATGGTSSAAGGGSGGGKALL